MIPIYANSRDGAAVPAFFFSREKESKRVLASPANDIKINPSVGPDGVIGPYKPPYVGPRGLAGRAFFFSREKESKRASNFSTVSAVVIHDPTRAWATLRRA